MMMQTQETMRLAKAVEAIESLLEAFSWRSGGGDGKIVAEAVDALDYLKEVKERAQLLILEEEHVQDAIKMAWRGLRFPEEWDRVNRSVTGVQRCFEFIKELASFEGEEPVTGSEHGRE